MNPEEFAQAMQARTGNKRRQDEGRPAMKAAAIAGAIGGWIVGHYAGLNLVLPLIGSLLAGWLATQWLGDDKKIIVPAFAIQAGHLLWMGLGLVLLRRLDGELIDIAWYLVGLAWLVARPGRWPLLFLGIYQALVLPINAYALAHASVGSAAHKALLVHVIWRVLALLLMGRLYLLLRRQRSGSAADVA